MIHQLLEEVPGERDEIHSASLKRGLSCLPAVLMVALLGSTSGQKPCSDSLLCNCLKVVTEPGGGPGPPCRPPKSPCCGLTSRPDCIVIVLFKWWCLEKEKAACRTKIIIILEELMVKHLYWAQQEAPRASLQDRGWSTTYAFW